MSNNTNYGIGSLQNNSGINNTGIGAYAAYNNLDASNNTVVGSNSAFFNTTGSNNTSMGAGSMCNNTTGSLNTAIGSSALEGILESSVGDQNTAIGVQSLYTNQGIQNTAIGAYSALGITGGNYNTFLGANSSTLNDLSYDYSTAIGYNSKIFDSNQIMMGGTGPSGYPNVIIPGNAYLPNFNAMGASDNQIVTKAYVDSHSGGGGGANPGQGLNATTIGTTTFLNVDSSLNFINYLDSTSGVTGASGTLTLGAYSTNTIIGPVGGNPVQFQSQIDAQQGITGPTGYFKALIVTGGITGTQFSGDLKPLTSGSQIFTTSINNVNQNFYPVFVSGTAQRATFVDNTAGSSFTYNPLTGTLTTSQISGGITGPTGSFQDLIVTNQITAQGGITGPTGSFQDLIVENEIKAQGGITGPTGSFSNLITSEISSSSNTITTLDRVYQELNSDPSWNTVNGYYGLAKDAYPALNPYSSGVKAVSTWTTRTTNDNQWTSICWSPELRLFAAVSQDGSGNRVMTSPDGITWTERVTPSPNSDAGWRSICWAPELGLFVAVASRPIPAPSPLPKLVLTSPDGENWTARTESEYIDWRSVCWAPELGLLVAVASGGPSGSSLDRVMTSPDGITWTAVPNVPEAAWFSVCWAPELGLFVAVASGGTLKVMTSPDGENWTARTDFDVSWRSVCWSPELGLFVAVAASTSETNLVMTSPDGITWTQRTALSNNWFSVCWSPELGLFCAVASGIGDRVMTSPDGINWTIRPTPKNNYISVCWAPELGIFAAVGTTGSLSRAMTSSFAGRPPTSYNVFDSSFNRIDENGNWTFSKFTASTSFGGSTGTPTLTVNDSFSNNNLLLIPNIAVGEYNPIVQTEDTAIVSTDSKPLSITTSSATNNGVRITEKTALIGAGGGSYGNPPTSSLAIDGSANSVVLRTGDINRLTINNTGEFTFEGGMTYNNARDTLTATTFNGTVTNTYGGFNPTLMNFFPENTFSTFGSLGTAGNKYAGGVLAGNGKIYYIPYNNTDIGIVDPINNTIDQTLYTGPPPIGGGSFIGGVVAPNGKIYCIPFRTSTVGVVDPIANTFSTFGNPGTTTNKYAGGVLAPNGKIYCIPFNASTIGVIDPINNSFSTFGSLGTTAGKYLGGVLAPNGNIYCIPANANNVGIIDPSNNSFSTFGSPGATTNKYNGGVLAPNGKIYCIPTDASYVGIIDPSDNSFSTFGSEFSARYYGGVLGLNGKIYCIPSNTDNVGIIDPVANSIDTTTISLTATGQYAGGVLTPSGNIYTVPGTSTAVGIIKTGFPNLSNLTAWPLQAYFNKL